MKYLVYLIYILLAIVFITVATQNSQMVSVTLTPDWVPVIGGFTYTAPLFVTIYIALFAGFAIGLFFEYLRESRYRRDARRSKKALNKTQKQLEKTKKDAGQHDDEVLAILE